MPSYMKSTFTRNRKALKDISGEGAAGGFGIDDGDDVTTRYKKQPEIIKEEESER